MATVKKSDTKVVPLAGDPEVTAELSRSFGLRDTELARAVQELGRNLTHAELGIISLLWSEREAQKSAKSHTKRLPAGGPHTVSTQGHAAGAIELGGGLCAVVALSTSQAADSGQAATTSAGHALRSVLATGARPLALLDSVHLGAPERPNTASALRDLAAKLGAYTRDAGVPVIGGNLQFDKRYEEHPLIQSVALGVARCEALVPAQATGLGNTIVFVGAQPAPQRAADERADAAAPDAFAQRRLTDACLAIFRLGSVAGACAIGPAGLAGAVVRLAQNGETGIEIDLDAVPRKAPGVAPFETLCAEGSEQLLLVVGKGREDSVMKALGEHDIEAQTVGRVTNTGRLVCKATVEGKQAVVADLPVTLLTRDAPVYEPPLKAASPDARSPELNLKRNEDAESELVRLLGSSNVGSREWLVRRLEPSARGAAPAAAPKGGPGDAAIIQLPAEEDLGGGRQLAISVDGNARCLALDPRQGAAMAIAECARNVVCVGAEPLGLAHGLSLADASQASTIWRLSEAIDGMHDACLALKLPVLTGAVSLGGQEAPGTPTVAVLGVLRDPADRLGIGFVRQADMVALIGALGSGNLSGSELAISRSGALTGTSPALDLGAEVKLQRAVLELARERLLSSAHDVSDGGLGVALAECCIAGRLGCSIELPAIKGADALQALFHEEPSRVVVSFPPEHRVKVQERCSALGVPFQLLGFVGGDTLEIADLLEVPVQVLGESHVRALDRIVES
jgi:phosphoribosylformylglycinamidine synthase subunit PurL